jgi:hypothetical protein
MKLAKILSARLVYFTVTDVKTIVCSMGNLLEYCCCCCYKTKRQSPPTGRFRVAYWIRSSCNKLSLQTQALQQTLRRITRHGADCFLLASNAVYSDRYRRFGAKCCPHFQDRRGRQNILPNLWYLSTNIHGVTCQEKESS